MRPSYRRGVNKGRSAKKFRRNMRKTKSVNVQRGGYRL